MQIPNAFHNADFLTELSEFITPMTVYRVARVTETAWTARERMMSRSLLKTVRAEAEVAFPPGLFAQLENVIAEVRAKDDADPMTRGRRRCLIAGSFPLSCVRLEDRRRRIYLHSDIDIFCEESIAKKLHHTFMNVNPRPACHDLTWDVEGHEREADVQRGRGLGLEHYSSQFGPLLIKVYEYEFAVGDDFVRIQVISVRNAPLAVAQFDLSMCQTFYDFVDVGVGAGAFEGEMYVYDENRGSTVQRMHKYAERGFKNVAKLKYDVDAQEVNGTDTANAQLWTYSPLGFRESRATVEELVSSYEHFRRVAKWRADNEEESDARVAPSAAIRA